MGPGNGPFSFLKISVKIFGGLVYCFYLYRELKHNTMKKYRILKVCVNPKLYRVQVKYSYWPFWATIHIFGTLSNTVSSIDEAYEVIELHKTKNLVK